MSVLIDHDIGRLDVEVEDAMFVDGLQRVKHLTENMKGLLFADGLLRALQAC